LVTPYLSQFHPRSITLEIFLIKIILGVMKSRKGTKCNSMQLIVLGWFDVICQGASLGNSPDFLKLIVHVRHLKPWHLLHLPQISAPVQTLQARCNA
jgi:hypothetical protein